MKENLLLIINPTAGSINVSEVMDMVEEWSNKSRFNIETYKTSGNNDEKKIEKLLQDNAYARVVAAGGDGTINMVASKLLNKDIVLGILACGSANGLATSMQIPKNLNQQFEIALNGDPFTIDSLFINDIFCAHIADIGINAELIYNY